MKRIFRMTIAWLLAVLCLPVIPAAAVQTNGIQVTAPTSPVKPGEAFTITVSLAEYTAEDPIRGLQVDLTGIDPALFDAEKMHAESLVSVEAPRNNVASYLATEQTARLLYISAEGESLPASESELIKVTLQLSETVTGSGSIPLQAVAMIVTESGNQPAVAVDFEIAYAQPVGEAAAAVIDTDGSVRSCETFDEAMESVQSGQTVQLLKDVQTQILMVQEDTSLDLNGFTLTARYVANFGDVIDTGANNSGLLKVTQKQLMMRKDNEQLPVWTGEGYRFVQMRSFNQAVLEDGKYAFQPLFEKDAHQLLLTGMLGDANETGVSVNVRVSWKTTDGIRTQNFIYNTDHIVKYIESYAEAEDKYGKMFTLMLSGAADFEDLTISACIKSAAGVEFASDTLSFATQ